MEGRDKDFIAEGSRDGPTSRPHKIGHRHRDNAAKGAQKRWPSGSVHQRLLHFHPLDMTTFRIQAI